MKWWREQFHKYFKQVVLAIAVLFLLYIIGVFFIGFLVIRATLNLLF